MSFSIQLEVDLWLQGDCCTKLFIVEKYVFDIEQNGKKIKAMEDNAKGICNGEEESSGKMSRNV